jgi:hypothetical protein
VGVRSLSLCSVSTVLNKRLKNVGWVGKIDAWYLRRQISRLRQTEHALENWRGEAEDYSVNVKLFPVRRTQNGVCVRGTKVIRGHVRRYGSGGMCLQTVASTCSDACAK